MGIAHQPTSRPCVGFWGKLPSRGDFVGAGLSRGFVTAWDQWMSQAIADSRATLGESWNAAWMVAPVWRYTAAPGLLGDETVTGLWMPSVDRAGRCFPLTLASEGGAGADWLDAAEEAGRAALEHDLTPEQLTAKLAPPAPHDDLPDPSGGSLWWTEGSPRVATQTQSCAALPGAAMFARMINGEGA